MTRKMAKDVQGKNSTVAHEHEWFVRVQGPFGRTGAGRVNKVLAVGEDDAAYLRGNRLYAICRPQSEEAVKERAKEEN